MVKFADAGENDVTKINRAEDVKKQTDEVKFVLCNELNFNWTKVQTFYQGQSE